MNINAKISLFKGAKDPYPERHNSLMWFFQCVKQGFFGAEIAAIRAATDPLIKDKLKKQLLAVTISGTFSHRSAANLIKHSGFICIDFDGKDNPQVTDWRTARNYIGSLKEVAFCALSASGNGCFAVIPLAYPDQHKSQFEALRRDFATLGYVIDKQGADVCRLRFFSSDPGAIINQGMNEYPRIYTPVQPRPAPQTYPVISNDQICNNAKVYVESKGFSFVNGSRNKYVSEFACYLHRRGVSQDYTLSRCLEFATSDFSAREIESIVRSIYRNSSWVKN
jgi:hypothetical protein